MTAKLVVVVREAHRGRATGWSVGCPDHGAMPFLAPSSAAAALAAERHVTHEHGGAGRVEVRDARGRVLVDA